jgi:protein disulfide-isomerase A1
MLHRQLLCIAALVLAGSSADVVVGNEKNFETLINDNKFVLAEFYAPWCGHCKNLEPEYAKAATTLKSVEGLVLVKVDATEERTLGEKYGVQGFPTLKFFRYGEAGEYGGGRDHDSIVSWVKKKTGAPSTKLTDQASIDTFAKQADAVLLGLFKEDDADFAEFEKAAGSIDDMQSGHTSDDDLIAKYAPAKVVVLQKFDDKLAKFDGKIEAASVKEFASANALPLVVTFTQDTQGKIFGESAPKKHLLAMHAEGYTDKANLERELASVAKEYRGKLLVITVEKTPDNEGVFNFFGVSDVTKPNVVSIDQSKGGMKKFFYDGELVHNAMKDWMADVFAGKLSATLKSEEPPADNNAPVKVIVGKTFKTEVVESGKDVMIEFYAPWCGHCKALEPEYNKLGETFKDVSSVVIAKMDATANEIDEASLLGVST